MKMLGKSAIAAALLAACAAVPATAQTGMPAPTRIDPIKMPGAIPLYPAGTPKLEGGAADERWNSFAGDPVVRNVTQPTLTAFLPDPAKATGAAVLVAPGGGFMLLSIKNEGWDVAKWLADHGVAAFVLKYRVNPTPEDETAFAKFGEERIGAAMKQGPDTPPPPVFQPAIDDGIAAMKLIRARAGEWKIDPNRLGMIGFSAGAMNTLSVTLAQQEGARPAFIGLIYGPMGAVTAPAGAPPLFAALASDDPLFARSGTGILESWRAAGGKAEFHLYQSGGHGFGMHATSTARLWPTEFLDWLGLNGFLGAPKQ
jgi:acetyl esterase/lipase